MGLNNWPTPANNIPDDKSEPEQKKEKLNKEEDTDFEKKDGAKLLFFTGVGIFIFTSLIFTVLLIMK